jgi:hypothetical protein
MDKNFVILICTVVLAGLSFIATMTWQDAKVAVSCNELKAVAIAASAPEPKCAQ